MREPVDRKAERRNAKIRKRRYGMRVSGRSVRLLWELMGRPRKEEKKRR